MIEPLTDRELSYLEPVPRCKVVEDGARCTRAAEYDSPGVWCEWHWDIWWERGVRGMPELPWMPSIAND